MPDTRTDFTKKLKNLPKHLGKREELVNQLRSMYNIMRSEKVRLSKKLYTQFVEVQDTLHRDKVKLMMSDLYELGTHLHFEGLEAFETASDNLLTVPLGNKEVYVDQATADNMLLIATDSLALAEELGIPMPDPFLYRR